MLFVRSLLSVRCPNTLLFVHGEMSFCDHRSRNRPMRFFCSLTFQDRTKNWPFFTALNFRTTTSSLNLLSFSGSCKIAMATPATSVISFDVKAGPTQRRSINTPEPPSNDRADVKPDKQIQWLAVRVSDEPVPFVRKHEVNQPAKKVLRTKNVHAGFPCPIKDQGVPLHRCPVNGCVGSMAPTKHWVVLHFKECHRLDDMEEDGLGRVSCPCQTEHGTCDQKLRRDTIGRHIIYVHIRPDVWRCPIIGCSWVRQTRRCSAERHIRQCHPHSQNRIQDQKDCEVPPESEEDENANGESSVTSD
ncbi:hypothetical protein B0H21DRAFT_85565 [Amylocystis lapponica]|nr:hypothetical protein B0H21DRAFT_85565 [Amylocystis lapponica]